MYTEEMLESIKKVEAKRAENAAMEPRRMTAEEKDQVLKENHPDYREDQFSRPISSSGTRRKEVPVPRPPRPGILRIRCTTAVPQAEGIRPQGR